MSYLHPDTVVAPQNRLASVEVLYNSGPDGGSLARLEFDGEECLGMRWNGSEEEPGIGNPQSGGRPTWFVLPKELADIIRAEVEKLANSRYAELLAGYREMAEDRSREAEARDWCEGLCGDAFGKFKRAGAQDAHQELPKKPRTDSHGL